MWGRHQPRLVSRLARDLERQLLLRHGKHSISKTSGKCHYWGLSWPFALYWW